MKPLWVPRPMRVPPRLDPAVRPAAVRPRHALLINPFYPKDAHASFGKHVLTPTLALTSVAAATPPPGAARPVPHHRQPDRHPRLPQPLRLLLPRHRGAAHTIRAARRGTDRRRVRGGRPALRRLHRQQPRLAPGLPASPVPGAAA